MTTKFTIKVTGCGTTEEIAESLRNIADDILERGVAEDYIAYEDATLYSQSYEIDEVDED